MAHRRLIIMIVLTAWIVLAAVGGVLSAAAQAAEPGEFTPCSGYTIPSAPAGQTVGYGPWASRLLIAFSDDGLNFTRANRALSDQADVPDAITMPNGETRVYYITWCPEKIRGQIVVAVTKNGEKWMYREIVLNGYTGPKSTAVDPTVEFTDDGKIRLYFTGFPGGGPNVMQSGRTYSALSTDGYTFTVEEGIRFALSEKPVLDPTVLKIGDTWHYFAGGEPGSNYHAISPDGLKFTQTETFKLDRILMSNGVAVQGGYRYYGFVQEMTGASIIRSVFTKDGKTWTAEAGNRLEMDTAKGLEAVGVKDAAVARMANGRYIMLYSTIIPGFPTQKPPGPPPNQTPGMPPARPTR